MTSNLHQINKEDLQKAAYRVMCNQEMPWYHGEKTYIVIDRETGKVESFTCGPENWLEFDWACDIKEYLVIDPRVREASDIRRIILDYYYCYADTDETAFERFYRMHPGTSAWRKETK